MDQLLDSNVNPRSISLIGTIIVAGTIAYSIAGLHATPIRNEALDTFLQKGVGNYRAMGSTKSRSVSESGTTYLIDGINETNRELGYLLLGELESTVGIISAYPPKEMTDKENSSNLPESSKYEISPNGSIINTNRHLMNSFTTGDAYATSGFTTLESPYSPLAKTLEEIEVIAMTQEVRDLGARINSIDDKYDKKIDGISEKLFQELKDISKSLSGIDGRLGIIETKVSGIENRTSNWKLYVLLPLITTACGGMAVFAITKILGY